MAPKASSIALAPNTNTIRPMHVVGRSVLVANNGLAAVKFMRSVRSWASQVRVLVFASAHACACPCVRAHVHVCARVHPHNLGCLSTLHVCAHMLSIRAKLRSQAFFKVMMQA